MPVTVPLNSSASANYNYVIKISFSRTNVAYSEFDIYILLPLVYVNYTKPSFTFKTGKLLYFVSKYYTQLLSSKKEKKKKKEKKRKKKNVKYNFQKVK